jgi:hypothetical protein
MNYSNELCQLVIKNMMVVEKAPEVASQVTDRLFEKINERIEDYIGKQAGWKGVYNFDPDQSEQTKTTFAPKDWPKDENNCDLAYYTLTYKDTGVREWLSVALGLEGSCMVLIFDTDESFFDNKVTQKKRAFENLSKTPRLVKAGFLYDRKDIYLGIYLPFSFLPDKVANEYPDFDESLAPLDESLDALISVHDIFDDFVKNNLSKNDEKTQSESME